MSAISRANPLAEDPPPNEDQSTNSKVQALTRIIQKLHNQVQAKLTELATAQNRTHLELEMLKLESTKIEKLRSDVDTLISTVNSHTLSVQYSFDRLNKVDKDITKLKEQNNLTPIVAPYSQNAPLENLSSEVNDLNKRCKAIEENQRSQDYIIVAQGKTLNSLYTLSQAQDTSFKSLLSKVNELSSRCDTLEGKRKASNQDPADIQTHIKRTRANNYNPY